MAQNFIACDRDQVMLLPLDLSEWLPDGHLARFVLETVDELDLQAIYGYYRQDGRGRPAHDPAMMVALVLYAYAVGVTSSRAIERRCVEDVAFRVISANQCPDHATIARFLVRHREALSELFFGVLSLCGRAGMVKVGTVAVDSTKLAANASAAQNRTLEGLRAEAARIIEEAIETDRREDELYGEKRGDELPAELADPRTRKARIKELLEQAEREREEIAADRAERIAEQERYRAEHGKYPGKRVRPQPGKQQQQRLLAKKYNLTDPDSGIVRHRGMLLQGYNMQTAASEGQVILAVTPVGRSPDGGQLAPMIEQARANLARIGITDPIGEVLADTGYWNIAQIKELSQDGTRVLVPPALGRIQTGRTAKPETKAMIDRLADPENAKRYRRRQQIIEPVFAHIKHHRGITRVLKRGKAAVQAEIDLIATSHNLLKLHSALRTA